MSPLALTLCLSFFSLQPVGVGDAATAWTVRGLVPSVPGLRRGWTTRRVGTGQHVFGVCVVPLLGRLEYRPECFPFTLLVASFFV